MQRKFITLRVTYLPVLKNSVCFRFCIGCKTIDKLLEKGTICDLKLCMDL